MKIGWTGKESAGKSQLLAKFAVDVLHRNEKWKKKREKMGLPFVPRTMAFDSPMSPAFVDAVENRYRGKYLHFHSLSECNLSDGQHDYFFHEILNAFPQRGNEPLTSEQIEFLTQGAKEGNNIYFATQDFSMVHKQFRLLTNTIYIVKKLIGSDRPVASAPPVKRIWGLVLYWEADPSTFKGDSVSLERIGMFPKFYFINRADTELYNTSYRVRGVALPRIKMVEQTYIHVDDYGKEIERYNKWVKR